jgi:hypothetical protein
VTEHQYNPGTYWCMQVLCFVYKFGSSKIGSHPASKSMGFGLRQFSTQFLAADRDGLSWILKYMVTEIPTIPSRT